MSSLKLRDIHYQQLDATTWYASAQIITPSFLNYSDLLSDLPLLFNPNLFLSTSVEVLRHMQWQYRIPTVSLSTREIAHRQRQQQRTGVRLLLQSLLNKLEMIDTLDDASFPYRLANSQYYVCFSHTGTHNKIISNQHKNKKTFEHLDNKVAVVISAHRPIGIDIEINPVKWQVAQRFFHANEMDILQTLPPMQRDIIAKLLWQIKESFIKVFQYKLAQGLGKDYSHLIADLIKDATSKSPLLAINDNRSNYRIALLYFQQIVIVY
ncbi:4'-phosphopantetheinyl transferase superfamily protein [Psychrobacter sp. van23A]|uniref:4'-phosphopantetheinyl transferase family protein n=1 Tax=Psychrobacter sp. van23A TaxID=3064892 RepID=UPI0027B909CD|nr:4'-phosphopantetheinyl transferase superfamily protein [Psychrobacter sp. van23A]WLW67382.1 4'-phosphopantetheinyl transferase superfamily protein [Psychrobacter sp. van23A]